MSGHEPATPFVFPFVPFVDLSPETAAVDADWAQVL